MKARSLSIIVASTILAGGCSGSSSDGWVEVIVASKQMGVGDFCTMNFEYINKTKYNFSDLSIEFVKRDASGNIIGKGYMSARTPPNGSGVASNMISPCSEVKLWEFVGIWELSKIDGATIPQKDRKTITSIPVKSASKVAGVSTKSPGGAVAVAAVATNNSNTNSNFLIQGVNPQVATRKSWEKFKDEGGLNSNSDFFGLNVTNVRVQFDQDKVKFALLNVSKSTAPKQIRASLSNICKSKDEDWKIQNGALTTGEITVGGITCSYLTNDTASNYDVVIERK